MDEGRMEGRKEGRREWDSRKKEKSGEMKEMFYPRSARVGLEGMRDHFNVQYPECLSI